MVRRTAVVAAAAVVVVAAAGVAVALAVGGDDTTASGPTPSSGASAVPTTTTPRTTTTTTTTAPTSSATTTEDAPGGDGAGPDEPGTSTVPGSPADVTVSYAGFDPTAQQVQVNAFAAVLENGGTCVLTLTDAGGGDPRTATAPASADATTTVCDQLTVDATTMSAGTWSATVAYSSPAHQGRSATTDVVVSR